MTKTVTATQARRDFFKLLREASRHGKIVRISLQGLKDDVIMMSADEWDGWMETMDIMSDPKLVKRLRQAEADPRKGISWEKVKRDLKL